MILRCANPASAKTINQTLADLSDYKQKLDIMGDALGISYSIVTIRGGVRLVAEAVTDEAKRRMPLSAYGVTKATFEIRRIDQDEIVNVYVNLPSQLSFWALIPPNPQAPDAIQLVLTIEKLLGVPSGGCRII